MATLEELRLNRFLYRITDDSKTNPFSFLGNVSGNSSFYGNPTPPPAIAVAPGTVIQSCLIQSSASDERIEINPSDVFYAYRNGSPVVIINRDGITTTRRFRYGGFDQPVIMGAGFVNAIGTPGTVFPSGWASANIGLGRYQITHNLNTGDYIILVTILAGTTREFSVESQGLNDFIVRIYNNAGGTLTDNDFYFTVLTNPA